MVDDTPENQEPSPDLGRAKRAPPTIDLEASAVSGESRGSGAGAQPSRSFPWPSRAAISAAVVAAISGAGAAALVISLAWLAGWPGEMAAPQVDTAEIEALASRVAEIEAKSAKLSDKPQSDEPQSAAAPDPAVVARIEAVEKSLASLRAELAAARKQSEKLAADVNEVKSAPRETSPAPELSAFNERLAAIERATRAQGAEIAQVAKPANRKPADDKPADDVALRRVVVAALLDVSVRQGDPYATLLTAAKSLVTNAEALKPLDGFAASGVPHAAALSRELLTLVPKLSPPAPENTTGSGIVDRLQAGAARLVRIERTDTNGNDRGAVIARVTAAALRNDFTEAKRELNALAPADRAVAQAWLDKSDARDAALAASRQFANEAMAALASSRSD
jgi:hypothetical protein